MELEKPNYRAVLFKIAMTEVWDISSGLGNLCFLPLRFIYFKAIHTSPLTHDACVAPVWVPYILRWGSCHRVVTSFWHQSTCPTRVCAWQSRLLAVWMFNFPLVARGKNFWFKDYSVISQLFFISPEFSKHCRCVYVRPCTCYMLYWVAKMSFY